ncbi:DUF4179 domain-containing protein [Antarcticibacterium sp. 1MA-6-2]|uniref:DUF4179 domain-containing protein n=1 Tax=Antarcticibacterium sp. 1MA-6-2 TaxID=2908210 RepID=UPI001F30B8D4|nr:DUF4179 domain-containing protein [Antarcticibacterium sp. 1MA-6-2]UJH91492.1 DUF4179 domain-containing protein [Antarcticibacterium sp. 1MA-6-2]
MDYNKFDDLFKEENFDIAEPTEGHQARFLNKLKAEKNKPPKGGKIRMLWSPIVAIAACLTIIFLVAGNLIGTTSLSNSGDLAGISPEMKETHQFYTNLIRTELAKVKAEDSPATQAIVKDALLQMEKLDNDYEKLKEDLKKSGQDKRVISAMITNLQQRIDLLNNVLEHIETIKELKNPNNENNFI